MKSGSSDREPLSPLSASQRLQLEAMIDQFELAADKGETLSLEDLSEESPELLPHLIASLRRLRTFDAKLSTVTVLPMPEWIGEFKVIEPIGVGSTGMVFRCRQTNPDREVAVKVLKPLLDVDEQQSRFQREMAAVSAINEAGMAAVYQTGIVEWGCVRCLWIAMELLNGGDICRSMKDHPLGEKQVLEKFRIVCETLRAAHRLGILHRDIKPSNILMSNDGMPHLVDFGIAKLPGSFAGVQPTEVGARSAQGTAAWMAPELLLADNSIQSDVRCEIFSLGVVLFEMLSGQHPFGAERLSVPQVAARISQPQQASLGEMRTTSSSDLIAFVSKLMAFDASKRYQNLDEVLRDLDLLVRGEPVTARMVSIRELTARWCRRHWIGVSFTAGICLTVVGILAAGWITSQRIQHQADLLITANRQLSEQTNTLENQAVELKESLQRRDRTISNGTLRSLQYIVETSPNEVQRTLNDPDHFPEQLRGFAWQLLDRESATDVQTLPNPGGALRQMSYDPTGRFLLTTSEPDQLTTYELQSGKQSGSNVPISLASSLAFRNHGESVLVVSSDRRLIELNVADGKQIRDFPLLSGMGQRFAVSDDGTMVVGLNKDHIPFLASLDADDLRPLAKSIESKPVGFWFTEGGKIVNCFDRDNGWRSWSVATLELLPQPSSFPELASLKRLHSIEFSTRLGNQGLLALGTTNGIIHLVSRDPERFNFRSIQVHADSRIQLRFLPPKHLVTFGQLVQLHSLHFDQAPRVINPRVIEESSPANPVAQVAAVSPDSRYIATGASGGDVFVSEIKTSGITKKTFPVFRGQTDLGFGFPKSLRALRGSHQFLIGHTGGWLANVDLETGKAVEAFPICKGPVNSIDLHPAGKFVAIGNGGSDQSICIVPLSDDFRFCQLSDSIFNDVPDGVVRLALKADVRRLRFTEDGSSLIAGLRNGEVLQLDCKNWRETNRWKCHEGGVFGMDVQKGLCVTGGTDGFIRLTRISDGTEVCRWKAHSKRIMEVLFSPDGSRIYSASIDGDIRIWTNKGQRLQALMAHVGSVSSMELSSDGMTLVSGGQDQRLLIWDAITGDLQREMNAHRDQLTALEFLPNDEQLLSSGLDSEVNLWGDGTAESELDLPLPR